MIRSRLLILFLVAILGKPLIQASPSDDDFLFIIAEDQSAFRYGTKVRPNPTASLERLALTGTVFRQAYFVWSRQLPAGQVGGPVSTGTVFPLLLDLCGVPPFPGSFYESPRAVIEAGEMPPDSSVVTFANRPTWFRTTEGTTVTHDRDGEIFVTGLDDRPIAP